jgi:hypothetical protein
MVAMAALCGTRIRYTCILAHLVGGVLAGDAEEGGESSGQCFHGVVDLVESTCVICLVLEDSDQFMGSMMTDGRWSLGACARKLPGYHKQRQAGCGKEAATSPRQWLSSGSTSLHGSRCNFYYDEMLCTFCELTFVNSRNSFESFEKKP